MNKQEMIDAIAKTMAFKSVKHLNRARKEDVQDLYDKGVEAGKIPVRTSDYNVAECRSCCASLVVGHYIGEGNEGRLVYLDENMTCCGKPDIRLVVEGYKHVELV